MLESVNQTTSRRQDAAGLAAQHMAGVVFERHLSPAMETIEPCGAACIRRCPGRHLLADLVLLALRDIANRSKESGIFWYGWIAFAHWTMCKLPRLGSGNLRYTGKHFRHLKSPWLSPLATLLRLPLARSSMADLGRTNKIGAWVELLPGMLVRQEVLKLTASDGSFGKRWLYVS